MSVYGFGLFTSLYSFHSRTFLTVETPKRFFSTRKAKGKARKVKLLAQDVIICYEEPIVIVGASCRRILGFNAVDFRLKFCTCLAIQKVTFVNSRYSKRSGLHKKKLVAHFTPNACAKSFSLQSTWFVW